MDKRERIDERGEWEKALSSKFEDYEPSIPDLPPLHISTRSDPLFSRWKRLAVPISVAAVIILALFLIRESRFAPEKQLSVSSTNNVISAEKSVTFPDALTDKESILYDQQEKNSLTLALNDEVSQRNDKRTDRDKQLMEETDEETDEVMDEDGGDANSDRDDGSDVLLSQPIEKPRESLQKLRSEKRRDLKLSLFTSGSTLAANTTSMTQMGDGIYAGEKEDYSVRETPVFEIGGTVLFPLTRRWALQSGLKYSWYRIEVKSNPPTIGDNYTLNVHSLGVPLDVQYTFYDSKAWRMYGQFGIGVNIPFKSTITGTSVNDGGATISLDSSLSFGLEYSVTNQLGLYTSFGVTYDLLQMQTNLPDANISRWHGKMEAGVIFRLGR